MGLDAMILVFWMPSFKPDKSSSRDSSVPLCFLPLGVWGYWYSSWESWFQLVLHPAQHFTWCTLHVHDFPGGSDSKAFAYNVGDLGSIPGSGRSPGVGNGNPLQYSCLENPWMEEPGRLQSMGPQKVGHNWATSLFTLHVSYISQVTIFILDVLLSFLNFAPVHCSMSSSNCCFLSCIEVSQDAGKVVWYFHLFKNLPVCSNPHKGFSVVNEAEVDHFFKIPLLYLWSKGCRQFDLWFLCLF